MYTLYKFEDKSTNFVNYLITKNIQQTLGYLSQLYNARNKASKLVAYLLTHNKKFYDLEKTILFQSDSLEEIMLYKNKLEDPSFEKRVTKSSSSIPSEILTNSEPPVSEVNQKSSEEDIKELGVVSNPSEGQETLTPLETPLETPQKVKKPRGRKKQIKPEVSE